MKSYTVLGYTADADTYCEDCASEIYGPFPLAEFDGAKFDSSGFTDREGNEVYPIFAGTEWDYQPACSNCGGIIDGVTVLHSD